MEKQFNVMFGSLKENQKKDLAIAMIRLMAILERKANDGANK